MYLLMTFILRLRFLRDAKGQKKSIWKQVKPIASSMKILARLIIGCPEEQSSHSFCNSFLRDFQLVALQFIKEKEHWWEG